MVHAMTSKPRAIAITVFIVYSTFSAMQTSLAAKKEKIAVSIVDSTQDNTNLLENIRRKLTVEDPLL